MVNNNPRKKRGTRVYEGQTTQKDGTEIACREGTRERWRLMRHINDLKFNRHWPDMVNPSLDNKAAGSGRCHVLCFLPLFYTHMCHQIATKPNLYIPWPCQSNSSEFFTCKVRRSQLLPGQGRCHTNPFLVVFGSHKCILILEHVAIVVHAAGMETATR